MRIKLLTLSLILTFACQKQTNESASLEEGRKVTEVVTSLLGKELLPMQPSASTKLRNDSLLTIAQNNFNNNPSEENYIWLGRRQAYRGAYSEAINTFTEGLEKYPASYRLLRHRGHRFISQRKLDEAISDFEVAATLAPEGKIEVEPDGMPNAQNIPLSNTAFNIYYHLGLAYYLKHDFEKAIEAYEKCMTYSINDDLLVATADWYYMTLMRNGQSKLATDLLDQVPIEPKIIENDAYAQRLLLYRGLLKPIDLLGEMTGDDQELLKITTQGYGVGNFYLYNGDTAKAQATFERVLKSPYWSAFGYIAAEKEVSIK